MLMIRSDTPGLYNIHAQELAFFKRKGEKFVVLILLWIRGLSDD